MCFYGELHLIEWKIPYISRILWFYKKWNLFTFGVNLPLHAFLFQVLESFKIMDYSLLLGIHILDHSLKEKEDESSQNVPDAKRPGVQKVLYSTAMESIQGPGKSGDGSITENPDTWVPGLLGSPHWGNQQHRLI